ncbi:thioredoxin [bacterium]|nr:thioredoxin [bacterium]
MSKIIEVTDSNFEEEVLNSDLPTEVDFWAPWCGPCKMVIPIYEKLAEEYSGRFKFCMINVDENRGMAMKYQIKSIPMQKFFSDGENVDEILGAAPEDMIRGKVEDILSRFPSSEKGRLKTILYSWVEHNKQDGKKFSKWKEKVEDMEVEPVYNSIVQAAQEVKEANERLSQLLIELEE